MTRRTTRSEAILRRGVRSSRDVAQLMSAGIADLMTGKITLAEARRINGMVKHGRDEVKFRGRPVRIER